MSAWRELAILFRTFQVCPNDLPLLTWRAVSTLRLTLRKGFPPLLFGVHIVSPKKNPPKPSAEDPRFSARTFIQDTYGHRAIDASRPSGDRKIMSSEPMDAGGRTPISVGRGPEAGNPAARRQRKRGAV